MTDGNMRELWQDILSCDWFTAQIFVWEADILTAYGAGGKNRVAQTVPDVSSVTWTLGHQQNLNKNLFNLPDM